MKEPIVEHLSERARRYDRAFRYIREDESLTQVRAKLSLYNLDCLIGRVLDAVYDEDAAKLELKALAAEDEADAREG